MTSKEIKAARIEIQKLIRNSEKKLLAKILKRQPKLIKKMKKRWDMTKVEILDSGFYSGVEYSLTDRY